MSWPVEEKERRPAFAFWEGMIEGRVRGQFEFSRLPRSTNPKRAVAASPRHLFEEEENSPLTKGFILSPDARYDA